MIHHLALSCLHREPPRGTAALATHPCHTPLPHLWLLPCLGVCTCSFPSSRTLLSLLCTAQLETKPRLQSALGPDRTARWPWEFSCSWWRWPLSTKFIAPCLWETYSLSPFWFHHPFLRITPGEGRGEDLCIYIQHYFTRVCIWISYLHVSPLGDKLHPSCLIEPYPGTRVLCPVIIELQVAVSLY